MHDAAAGATALPTGHMEHESLRETRQVLEEHAKKRFAAIPSRVIADHVVAITRDADTPVRTAALDALIRRMAAAQNDGLRVATRPARGAVLGEYTTRRAGRARQARPYTTLLESVEPIAGACDCPDFTKSSLGLCKHLLVVLDRVYSAPGRLAKAQAEAERHVRPRLAWDPSLPLTGAIDRLAGLSWRGPRSPLAKRWFGADGRVHERALEKPGQRRKLVAELGRARVSVSPAARAVLSSEAERLERRLACESAAPKALRQLGSLKRKLYPYQREGVQRFLRCGRLLLADDMGLGKTTQAIAACHALFRSRRVRRGLLVVPASLKSQWLREWQQTSDVPVELVEGRPEERARAYRAAKAGFLVIGYEQLLRDFEHVRALAPELVVLDEAQRIKNWATKSARLVKALDPEHRLVLTGTPMENRLEELASLLDWVDDVALAPKWRLVPWYTLHEGDGGSGRAGARNLQTLRRRLEPCLLRRVRREVIAQLPSRTDTRVPVEMTEAQRYEHDELAQPIAQLVAIRHTRPLRQHEFLTLMQLLTKQRMISNGLGQVSFESLWSGLSSVRPDDARLKALHAPKLFELRRLVQDLVVEQERKVVVFSQWRRMLRLAEWSLRDVLGDAGLRAVFFTGAERSAQRTRSVVDFHDDPSVRMMFLSDAGGVGLNLQRAASACINLELPWNPAVLEQRIGRIHRLGQKRPIDVYNLVCEYGIEARISSLVANKRALFDSVFDGQSDAVRFDGSAPFLEQVERLLEAPEPLELDEDAADAAPDTADDSDSLMAAPAPTADVANLIATLRVERTAGGGVRIEAPPEAAGALSALFATMARLVSASSGDGVPLSLE